MEGLQPVWSPALEDDANSVQGDASDDDHPREPEVGCNEECRIRIRFLRKEIKRLHKKLAGRQKTRRTWPRVAQRLGVPPPLEQGPGSRPITTKVIYELSCREENSSHKILHPALVLDRPTVGQIQTLCKTLRDTSQQLQSLVLQPRERRLFLEYTPRRLSFSFEDLPKPIKLLIFTHLFEYPDTLIHAVSRLDPFVGPAKIPSVGGQRSGLLNRFHMTTGLGKPKCSLTFAIKGSDLLSPFLVCKQWYFWGAHVFYGRNTFAFSSFGELGRFAAGIGPARRQRLQHIELCWVGSRDLTLKGHSRRTQSLAYLCEMFRLRSLKVYLDESSLSAIRRPSESIQHIAYLAKKTDGQPSHRLKRNLHCLQGLDYVKQLRGLRVISFIDLMTMEPVRDWHFTMVLEASCKREKSERGESMSSLQALFPLVGGFRIAQSDWDIVTESYDTEWNPPHSHLESDEDPHIYQAPASVASVTHVSLNASHAPRAPSTPQFGRGREGEAIGEEPILVEDDEDEGETAPVNQRFSHGYSPVSQPRPASGSSRSGVSSRTPRVRRSTPLRSTLLRRQATTASSTITTRIGGVAHTLPSRSTARSEPGGLFVAGHRSTTTTISHPGSRDLSPHLAATPPDIWCSERRQQQEAGDRGARIIIDLDPDPLEHPNLDTDTVQDLDFRREPSSGDDLDSLQDPTEEQGLGGAHQRTRSRGHVERDELGGVRPVEAEAEEYGPPSLKKRACGGFHGRAGKRTKLSDNDEGGESTEV